MILPFPACPPTKVFCRVVGTPPVGERTHKMELSTKGDNHAPRRAVVEDNHVGFVRYGASHELLRAYARAQSSLSRQRIGDAKDVGRVLDKSNATLIEAVLLTSRLPTEINGKRSGNLCRAYESDHHE